VHAEVERDSCQLQAERGGLLLALLRQADGNSGVAVDVVREIELRLAMPREDEEPHRASLRP
jgi:hypothetical protein